MVRIIAGGKKHQPWVDEVCKEYQKRLRKPFEISWEFVDEEKLGQKLTKWPFSVNEYVICCDERGKNISSSEYLSILNTAFIDNKDVVILIGGAFGFDDFVRKKSDFVWSFSKLVFPHMIARLIVVEQTYRAQEINKGGKYHHE